jgi:putative acetyltransferase
MPLVREAVVPIAIAPECPDQPEIRAFFAASDTHMAALYPAESNHMMDVAALTRPNVHFLVAGHRLRCHR